MNGPEPEVKTGILLDRDGTPIGLNAEGGERVRVHVRTGRSAAPSRLLLFLKFLPVLLVGGILFTLGLGFVAALFAVFAVFGLLRTLLGPRRTGPRSMSRTVIIRRWP